MNKATSDTQKFFKTMWFMAKSEILPWTLLAGIIAFGIVAADKAKTSAFGRDSVKKAEFFQHQR